VQRLGSGEVVRGRIQSSGKQEEAGVRCCARDAMTPACSNGDGSAFAGCRSSSSLSLRLSSDGWIMFSIKYMSRRTLECCYTSSEELCHARIARAPGPAGSTHRGNVTARPGFCSPCKRL
jgi:hypothetical protein